MSRLPPAEKLPLATRKNIRDEWDSKKADYEAQLSELLGEAWTIDIDPLSIWPYGEENGYAKQSTGSMIAEYVSSAISQLKSFVDRQGEDVKQEINAIASAHALTMDLDEHGKFSYNGVVVSPSGQLVILFGRNYLGTNIYDALEPSVLARALNEAPSAPADLPLSFTARRSIKADYDAQIGPVREKIAKLLGKELELDPGFDQVFAKLKSAPGAAADDRWEVNLGSFVFLYMEGLANCLQWQKFGDDDMMREAFHDAVDKGKVVFRVVDEGQMKKTYNECVVEDGVLYLQTVPQYFGTNVNDVAERLEDLL